MQCPDPPNTQCLLHLTIQSPETAAILCCYHSEKKG